MKKGIALLLALMLCLSMLAACTPGEEEKAPTYEPNIAQNTPAPTAPAEEEPPRFTPTYEDGVLTIHGEGVFDLDSMFTIKIDGISMISMLNSFHRIQVVMGEGITEIWAMGGSDSVVSMTLPESLKVIGDSAFQNNKNLPEITIPKNVTFIGKYAFYGCDKLTTMVIPEGVTEMGIEVFKRCFGLEEVTLPGSLSKISDGTFDSCTALTGIAIPDGIKEIGARAFTYCISLTHVTIPETVERIGSNAFSSCKSLTSVTIPEGVTEIGDYAFAYCESLTDVTIPQSVVKIGKGAFASCPLGSVIIPNSDAVIGEDAFDADVAVGR